MFLGALLDAGLSRKQLEADLAGLGIEHKLKVTRVRRGALAARHVEVRVPKPRPAKGKKHARGAHSHHAHGRHHSEIVGILERAKLVPSVRERALAIFQALGVAEAKVHGIPIEKVHFHEVGAVDAIVDVTAAAIALERLEIEHTHSDGARTQSAGRVPDLIPVLERESLRDTVERAEVLLHVTNQGAQLRVGAAGDQEDQERHQRQRGNFEAAARG